MLAFNLEHDLALALAQNLALALAMTFILGSIWSRLHHLPAASRSAAMGLLFGLTAIASMGIPAPLSDGVFVDARHVLVSLAGLFGGPLAALFAGVMAVAYRLHLGGDGALAGASAAAAAAATGACFRMVLKKGAGPSVLTLLLLGLAISCEALASTLLIQSGKAFEAFSMLAGPFFLSFPPATILIGGILQRELNRRAYERLLRFTQTSIDHAGEAAYWAGLDGKLVYVNNAAERTLGYTRDELMSMRVADVDGSMQSPTWDKHIKSVQSGGRLTLETTHRRKDGSTFPVEATIHSINHEGQTYICGLTRDITSRKQAEDALKESERRLRAYIDNSPAGIFITDNDGKFIDANPSACQMSGYGKPELVNLHIWDLGLPQHTGASKGPFEALRDTGEMHIEAQIEQKDGSSFWATLNAVRLSEDRFMGICVDVSEQRRLAEQLRQAQKMEAIGLLAGGIAHDFNNLLQAITGYTDLAMSEAPPEPPSLGESLTEVRKAADRAAALTRQLLTFSRRETLQPRVLNLNTILTDLKKMLDRLLGEHIDFTLQTDDDLQPIYADAGQIEQIVMNLCVNARDAMSEGGTLTIETANVTGAETAIPPEATADAYVSMTIRDNGSGIAPEVQERVFEPFFTTKEVGQGTGLGLATAYAIVTSHKGFIQLTSDIGKGTQVRILLPATKDLTDSNEPPQPSTDAPGAVPGDQETILLAEDEPLVRGLIKNVLARAGYDVTVASDGQEAVDIIERDGGRFDAAVIDVVMPKQSGLAVWEALQAHRPNCAVLFSSGYSHDSLENGQIPPGARLIHKPYTPTALLKTVREILDR